MTDYSKSLIDKLEEKVYETDCDGRFKPWEVIDWEDVKAIIRNHTAQADVGQQGDDRYSTGIKQVSDMPLGGTQNTAVISGGMGGVAVKPAAEDMGDASTRKDEGTSAGRSKAFETSPTNTSEISEVDDAHLMRQICGALKNCIISHGDISKQFTSSAAKRVLHVLRPYLRTTEPSIAEMNAEKWQQVLDDAIAYRKLKPVSVSLEKVRLAICAFEGKDPAIWSYKGMAKAVLDEAIKQGAKFDVKD